MPTLSDLNAAPAAEALALLDGIYEHSAWIAAAVLAARPFASLAALKLAMARVVDRADPAARLALIRAHPELAGKAARARTLTVESTDEQTRSGLTHCSDAEYEQLQALNQAYNARFGFPFILAVRGPRGLGLSRTEVIATFERRLSNPPDFERDECIRQIHRIAELRLDDRFGWRPVDGEQVWDMAEALAAFSDPGFAERGELTVTYLTDAHRACAARLRDWMQDAGFDTVRIDAVGNVRGRYHAADPAARTLYTGSHYDTVRNGGRYDGRLGILVPIVVVAGLRRRGVRPPVHLEVIGFAEEEGQRYPATFLGSSALVGEFDPDWLGQRDADGVTMRDAMAGAGLDPAGIDACRVDAGTAAGFVEIHIEQGPVLCEMGLPLAAVTSINGGSRFAGEVLGTASHAGTTPMDRLPPALGAVAELALQVERRAAADGDSVGTIGIVEVPGGSINVVPGRCRFTLDLRSPDDARRQALVDDVRAALAAICARRGVASQLTATMTAAAAPSDPALQRRWEAAITALGLPVHRMPSGAGHDAMKLHRIMPQAMLFVRGGNSGISHNPLESVTADDIQCSVDALRHLLEHGPAAAPPDPGGTDP